MRPLIGTELIAGAISALVMLPQAVVLATLAGMPPEHGIYASVFPAIVASVFGAHRLVLTGPNTTIALMAGSLVASIAALDSPPYVALMLLVSLLVGLVQLGLGLGGGGALLRFLPDSALSGVTSAVGLTIVLSQLSTITGILYLHDDAAWINALRCMFEANSWEPGALLTGLATVAVAAVVGNGRAGKFAVPGAMAAGTFVALLWTTTSGRQVEMLGRLDVAMLVPSLPRWSPDYLPYYWQIAMAALSIALMGLLQTAVIARSLASGQRGRLDLAREFRAQGLANLCAAFTSGMPVSGSFNRSAAHAAAGARSALSGIAASLILLLAARYGAAVICYLPLPVTGGVLLYIGWRLIDKAECGALFAKFDGASRQFLFVTLCGVFVGITVAVLVAAGLSIAAYLRRCATPRLRLDRDDTRFEQTLTFEGDLFFGTVPALEDALQEMRGASNVGLVLRTKYIDRDGHSLLARECKWWTDAGARLHVVFEVPMPIPGVLHQIANPPPEQEDTKPLQRMKPRRSA